MIHALIGHRGVGKTSLLRRIQKYRPDAIVFCLDERIEEIHGPISAIFKEKGEAAFRKIEKDVFINLMQAVEILPNDVYISVGAGFSEPLPSKVHVLWIRRDIDASKLVFLNRPTLNANKDDLNMPLDIYNRREQHYSDICDEEIILPEGEYDYLEVEKKFFTRTIKNIRGTLTVLPESLNKTNFLEWLKARDGWGLDSFELRNDLLSEIQIEKVLSIKLRTPLLYSFRHNKNLAKDISAALKCANVDWDITLGDIPKGLGKHFVSFHSNDSFQDDFEKVKNIKTQVKWSPLVSNWENLEKGHLWAMESPSTRTFLPRSHDGRWNWYRRISKNKMGLHFFREGRGSASDQPTLLEWMSTHENLKHHAAVIGAPITHSWSPLFHYPFFTDLKMNMYPIHLEREEANANVLKFLERLGFVAFAVTSPLKAWAQNLADSDTSINTLVIGVDKKRWQGYSTDMVGFEQLLFKVALDLKPLDTAIWGSGSMAEAIRTKYPHATIYSARSGKPAGDLPQNPSKSPQVLIWASGESGMDVLTSQYPHWKPLWVVDLNYRQDSPAISFAHKWGARYVPGTEMFFGQAREQQKIWKKELKLT